MLVPFDKVWLVLIFFILLRDCLPDCSGHERQSGVIVELKLPPYVQLYTYSDYNFYHDCLRFLRRWRGWRCKFGSLERSVTPLEVPGADEGSATCVIFEQRLAWGVEGVDVLFSNIEFQLGLSIE